MKLEDTLRTLFDHGVEFVLIGGAAMQLQGSARLTDDLDFCYARNLRNCERLAAALAPFHPRLRNAPEGLPFRFDAATIQRGLNFTLSTDLGPLDFFAGVSGIGSYDSVRNVSETMSILAMNCQVLSLTGLIKTKLAAGRGKDLDAIKELESLQEAREKAGF